MARKPFSISSLCHLMGGLAVLFATLQPVSGQETSAIVPSNNGWDSDGDGIPDEKDPAPLIAEIQHISWRILPVRVGWDFSGTIDDITTDLSEEETQELETKNFSYGYNGVASASVDTNASGTLSLNPLALFRAEGSMEVRSRLAADGYVRGGKESQTRAGELRRLVSRRQVATRLTGLHLDFTVEFFNHSPFDFEGRSLEIPVKAGSEVLAIAQSVGAAGPVPAFRIPAGRGRAIPVRFRADLDTTRSLALLDEMAKGELFLAIEESQGALVAVDGDSAIDAISSLVATGKKTARVTIDLDGETYTWMVARREADDGRELTIGDALTAINAWAALRGGGQTKVGLFALGEGYLRSALGRDNQLSPVGWWGVPAGDGDGSDDLRLDAPLSDGIRLIYSRRLPQDLGHWIDRADADGDPDPWVLVLAGRALGDRNREGDGERAVELWMQAAELGNSDAIYYLGRAYYKGEGGLTVDKRQGVEWWQKAAELGDAGAMRNLGSTYYVGEGGLTEDKRQAVEWWQKAAELGDAAAMRNLGRAYSEGEGGLPKDQRQAVEWWRKAAELGDAVAMTSLGVAYSEGKGGLPEDQRQAVEWFRKAADLGEEWGMFLLGAGYSKGLGGLPQDSRQAVEWYRKAAELGNATAMFYLGIAYYNGEGGLPEDKPEAVEWWHKAEETGYELSEETKTLMRAVR